MANLSIPTSSPAIDRQADSIVRHLSVWNIIFLHLFPGALITAFFFITGPGLIRAGFPPIMSLYLAILFILIPFELGFLFYQGKKRNGRFSLDGVILLREGTSIGQMIIMIMVLFAWGGLVFTLLPWVDTFFAQTLFGWFPDWSHPANLLGNSAQYSKNSFQATIITGFILNGIAGPIVEELYFRGYLLPRIPSSKSWAPIINIVLFSLYHFFSPWQGISRILAFLPLAYTVFWKRNIRISMWVHCLLNTAGMIIALVL